MPWMTSEMMNLSLFNIFKHEMNIYSLLALFINRKRIIILMNNGKFDCSKDSNRNGASQNKFHQIKSHHSHRLRFLLPIKLHQIQKITRLFIINFDGSQTYGTGLLATNFDLVWKRNSFWYFQFFISLSFFLSVTSHINGYYETLWVSITKLVYCVQRSSFLTILIDSIEIGTLTVVNSVKKSKNSQKLR